MSDLKISDQIKQELKRRNALAKEEARQNEQRKAQISAKQTCTMCQIAKSIDDLYSCTQGHYFCTRCARGSTMCYQCSGRICSNPDHCELSFTNTNHTLTLCHQCVNTN